MSEKVKRSATAVPNGVSGGKAAGGQAGNFSTSMFKIFSQLDELRKAGNGMQEYETLCQELQRAKQEANDKAQEMEVLRRQCDGKAKEMQGQIAELERDKDCLTRQFETRFKAWDEDRGRHLTEFAELKQLREELVRRKAAVEAADREKRQLCNELAKHRGVADQYLQQVSELQEECETREVQLKMKEQEMKKTEKELKGCRETLAQLNDEIGIQAFDQKRMERKFEELAARSHKLVRSYFDRDIADLGLLANGPVTVSSRIPQAASNSPAARAMRCASAEALIAHQLSTQIFVDFYPLDREADIEISGLVRALEWLDVARPLQATIIRCQLAKVCNESRTAEKIPKQATDVVCGQLGPWLSYDSTRAQQFATDLEGLFSTAMELWQKLQCTRTRVKAAAGLAEHGWFFDDDSRAEYGGRPAEDDGAASGLINNLGGPLAVLFPQIRTGRDTEDSSSSMSLLFHGFALFPAQALVMAATSERGSQAASRRASAYQRRRTSDGEGEPQRTSRRLSNASREGGQQRSVLGAASDSERASLRSSVKGRADHPTASVSSTRSQRST
ncbi:hypothetical protein B0T22DRAFT_212183 [Podospora appendiculata]|uniref:Uncharacterized protein n=1 Tax=Podospora appendiculata TaxID=314037 RepID=A0AAE0X4R4_9PEZI|nr:hypothetical protein B0T22DRAFT_212183 [Podospora appendiculata]